MNCKKCEHVLTKNGLCRHCNNPSKLFGSGFKGKTHKEKSNEKRSVTIKKLYQKGKKMGFGCKNGYRTPKGNIPWNKGKKSLVPAWNKLPERKIKCKYCGKRLIVSQNSKKQFCSSSCWTKYRFLADDYFKKKVEQLHNGKQERISKWAKKIGNILKKNKIFFEYEYKVKRLWADLYVPKYNLLIECDGEYWHNYPHGNEKDFRKIETYKKEGYNVLNLWNSTIDKLDEREILYLIKYETIKEKIKNDK